jgi:hypothetical protein
MFFHVDPGDRDGMLAYTQEVGREEELWEISGCVGKEMSKHKKKKRRQSGKPQYVILAGLWGFFYTFKKEKSRLMAAFLQDLGSGD